MWINMWIIWKQSTLYSASIRAETSTWWWTSSVKSCWRSPHTGGCHRTASVLYCVNLFSLMICLWLPLSLFLSGLNVVFFASPSFLSPHRVTLISCSQWLPKLGLDVGLMWKQNFLVFFWTWEVRQLGHYFHTRTGIVMSTTIGELVVYFQRT